jgi:hypothetical protein
VAVVACGLALVVLALGVVEPPARITWTRGTAQVALVAFAVLGAGLIIAGMASLAGLLGPATPGGFRDNDLAAVALLRRAVPGGRVRQLPVDAAMKFRGRPP